MEIQICDNLFIRKVELSDAKETYSLIDKNREYLKQWLSWVDYKKCEKDQLDYIIKTVIADRTDNKEKGYKGTVLLYPL